ncbi:unnamed protein product [Miscanthus lutarioriparius]|uniref:Uncharacterized protein n=1 Tax=Miscanthus lutarioriparius TaxID=422564 RepID=A0A811NRX2_9POAL|nr:unnamed protein product [Miscanthus lutarioriparius]
MAMLPGNNDDVLARLMRAVVEDPPQALAAVGVATCATVVRAGAALPVGGGRVWLLEPLLVACFFGGVGAMLASVWVGADVHRRRATGHIVLAVAVVSLLVGIGLSDFDPQIALNIFDAML